MKLSRGRHCPVLGMIIVGSKMCHECDDFVSEDDNHIECKWMDSPEVKEAQKITYARIDEEYSEL